MDVEPNFITLSITYYEYINFLKLEPKLKLLHLNMDGRHFWIYIEYFFSLTSLTIV